MRMLHAMDPEDVPGRVGRSAGGCVPRSAPAASALDNRGGSLKAPQGTRSPGVPAPPAAQLLLAPSPRSSTRADTPGGLCAACAASSRLPGQRHPVPAAPGSWAAGRACRPPRKLPPGRLAAAVARRRGGRARAPATSAARVGSLGCSKAAGPSTPPTAVGFLRPAREPLGRIWGASSCGGGGARMTAPMMVRLGRWRGCGACGEPAFFAGLSPLSRSMSWGGVLAGTARGAAAQAGGGGNEQCPGSACAEGGGSRARR
mmetsp:Transcript_75811/g.239822  ORF Transcript_75811/g.239822 Transcript_75811/m.239822 type:complete len:259 (-) Transcript_75811:1145-1921(-)